MINYQNYISINNNIRFGKPCIIGSRISVYDVLQWLANGMSEQDILEDFPQLHLEHIRACLAFGADKMHKLKVAS